jgi:hypothetical protein
MNRRTSKSATYVKLYEDIKNIYLEYSHGFEEIFQTDGFILKPFGDRDSTYEIQSTDITSIQFDNWTSSKQHINQTFLKSILTSRFGFPNNISILHILNVGVDTPLEILICKNVSAIRDEIGGLLKGDPLMFTVKMSIGLIQSTEGGYNISDYIPIIYLMSIQTRKLGNTNKKNSERNTAYQQSLSIMPKSNIQQSQPVETNSLTEEIPKKVVPRDPRSRFQGNQVKQLETTKLGRIVDLTKEVTFNLDNVWLNLVTWTDRRSGATEDILASLADASHPEYYSNMDLFQYLSSIRHPTKSYIENISRQYNKVSFRDLPRKIRDVSGTSFLTEYNDKEDIVNVINVVKTLHEKSTRSLDIIYRNIIVYLWEITLLYTSESPEKIHTTGFTLLVSDPVDQFFIVSCTTSKYSYDELLLLLSLKRRFINLEYLVTKTFNADYKGVQVFTLERSIGCINPFIEWNSDSTPKLFFDSRNRTIPEEDLPKLISPKFNQSTISINFETKTTDLTNKIYVDKDFTVIGFLSEIYTSETRKQSNTSVLVVNVNESIQVHMEISTPSNGDSGILKDILENKINKLCIFINCFIVNNGSDSKFFVEKRIKYSIGTQYILLAEEYIDKFPGYSNIITTTLNQKGQPWTYHQFSQSRLHVLDRTDSTLDMMLASIKEENKKSTDDIKIKLRTRVVFSKLQIFSYKEGEDSAKRVELYKYYCTQCRNRMLKFHQDESNNNDYYQCTYISENRGCGMHYPVSKIDGSVNAIRKFNFQLLTEGYIPVNISSDIQSFETTFLFGSVEDYINECYRRNRLPFGECEVIEKDPLNSFIDKFIINKEFIGTFSLNRYPKVIDNSQYYIWGVSLDSLVTIEQTDDGVIQRSVTGGITYTDLTKGMYSQEVFDFFLPCPPWSLDEYNSYKDKFPIDELNDNVRDNLTDEEKSNLKIDIPSISLTSPQFFLNSEDEI